MSDEKKEKNVNSDKIMGEKIMADALEAYGIGPNYVFSSKIYPETGEVVIVTNG